VQKIKLSLRSKVKNSLKMKVIFSKYSRFFLWIALVLNVYNIDAQQNKSKENLPVFTETSDKEAKTLLDKVKKQYFSYSTLSMDFSLTYEMGNKKDVKKGAFYQQGNNYHIQLPQQTIISDGKSNWLYSKKNNTVQVSESDVKSSAALVSPRSLLEKYDSGKFIYGIVGEGTEFKKNVVFVEFKPINKNEDYFKIRLAIDKKSNQFVSFRIFNKDASRVIVQVDKQQNGLSLDKNLFTFDAAKYPGVKVEDLRID